ncbi:hypothetical protein CBS101457_002084 [Exobasidium rhododendri]|nr:hypothetical protein CBS101457_002084 [Exobasidium rhododendri]
MSFSARDAHAITDASRPGIRNSLTIITHLSSIQPSRKEGKSAKTPQNLSPKVRAVPVEKRVECSSKSAIPRPPNAWILYRSAKIKERSDVEWTTMHHQQQQCDQPPLSTESESCNSIASGSLTSPAFTSSSTRKALKSRAKTTLAFCSKKVADMWRAECQDVRDHYFELAREKKLQHEEMFPGYKYRPRRDNSAHCTEVAVPTGEKDDLVCADHGENDEEDASGLLNLSRKHNQPPDCHIAAGSKAAKDADSKGKCSQFEIARDVDSTWDTQRPASSAKTKANGPPNLCIDVQAAEQGTDLSFANFLNMPLVGLNNSLDGGCRLQWDSSPLHSSAIVVLNDYINSNLATCDMEKAVNCYMQERAETYSCPSTSQASSNVFGIDTWTDSNAPWTNWIASPLDLTSVGGFSQATFEAILPQEHLVPKDTISTADTVSPVQSPGRKGRRRKRPPNGNIKRPAKGTGKGRIAATQSDKSPAKRLKKALICKDESKILAWKSKLQEDQIVNAVVNDNSKGTSSMASRDSREEEISSATAQVQSYDRQSSDKEVFSATPCSDALVESFASMTAWMPHRDWYSGLTIADSGEGERDPFSASGEAATSWNFYGPSSPAVKNTLTEYTWPSSAAPPTQSDDGEMGRAVAECLNGKSGMSHGLSLSPVLMSPGDFMASLDGTGHLSSSMPALSPCDECSATIGNAPAIDDASGGGTVLYSAMSDQEWDHLLTQAIFYSPARPDDSNDTQESVVDTSPECLWDLVHFDCASQTNSTDVESEVLTTSLEKRAEEGSSRTASLVSEVSQTSSVPLSEDVPVIELHGTFTEGQLLEKLRMLQRTSSRSHIIAELEDL